MVIIMSKSDYEFTPEEDIQHNQRRHDVPPLRFIDISNGEDLEVEERRYAIWELYLKGMNSRQIARELDIGRTPVTRHIKKCKEFYDKWVSDNGLDLHGDPANRLEDTIADLEEQLNEVKGVANECLAEGDVRGFKDLQRLMLDIKKDIAKFKNVEPPKNLNVSMSSAEETRKMMQELFPSDDED